MKALAYWPFGIAMIWAPIAAVAVMGGHQAASDWLLLVGAVMLPAVAYGNARLVRKSQRPQTYWISPELAATIRRHPSSQGLTPQFPGHTPSRRPQDNASAA